MSKERMLPKLRREAILLLFTLIYAFSVNRIAADILHFDLSSGRLFLLVLAAALIFAVIFFNVYTWVICTGLLAAGALLVYLTPLKEAAAVSRRTDALAVHFDRIGDLLGRFFKEGFSFFNESLTASEKESYLFFAGLFVVLTTFLTVLFIQKIRSYWLPSFVMVLLVPVCIKNAGPKTGVFLIPMALVCFGMILLSSGHLLNLTRKRQGMKQLLAAGTQLALVLLLAALVAVLSVQKISYQDLYSPYWQGITDDLMTLLPEGLQPRLTVTPFSLGRDGYYPLEDRLGGPAEEKNETVALLKGDAPSLLKVQTSDYYDGLRWQRVLNNPNYRFSSPFNGGVESKVFNEMADEAFLAALSPYADRMLYRDYSYELKPLRGGTQILFVSGTPTALHSAREEALLFYFNQAGTLFARTTFDNEHPYSVESVCIEPDALGLLGPGRGTFKAEQLQWAYEESKDEAEAMDNREQAYTYYLQLPDTDLYKEGGALYELARELTASAGGSYEKVDALLDYFTNNPEFVYTLNPDVPPENVDFLAHFLKTKEGYCTYYATAMTMLSRLAGVPARFAEGYALTAENEKSLAVEEGIEIKSENAHAWTEVYLDGLGWVACDPTPGGVGGHGLPDQPEITPSPTPTPTPTPSPDEPTAPTTTPPESSRTTTAENLPPDKEENDSGIGSLLVTIALILLVLLLLAFLFYLYMKRRKAYIASLHETESMRERLPDTRKRADFYWEQLADLYQLITGQKVPAGKSAFDLAILFAREEARAPESENAAADKADTPDKTDAAEVQEAQEAQAKVPVAPVSVPASLLKEWENRAALISEVRYSTHHISDADLLPLSEAFDAAEDAARKKLGERQYLMKRILPPQQGKLPKG